MKRLLLTFAVAAAGCDIADLPIDVEPAPPQLVVSSFVGPGPSILVTVSRSFSALSATDFDSLSTDFIARALVDSADVTLSHQGGANVLEPVGDVPGLYAGFFPDLQPFEPLELSVVDEATGERVSAETGFMPPVALEGASVRHELTSTDDTTTVLTYRFTDLPGENYYALHAYRLPSEAAADTLDGDELLARRDDLIFYETLLTDQSFETSTVADTVRIPFFSVNESIAISLSHISEGYFRFLEARRRTGGLLSSLANEPVTHPTNVQGGLGFFSAHQPSALVIDTTN